MLASLLLAEATFRVLKAAFGRPSIYQYDAELGWAPRPEFRHEFTSVAQDGEHYPVQYETNLYGFRQWGDPSADRPRLLFVGDSFTQDPNMSNRSAFYSKVAEMLPAEVFAVGGGGYGTLQEMLISRRYLQLIDPTHVIIQFCSNDFQNNHYESETRSIVRNQKNFRPYVRNGKIEYRNAHLYRWLYQTSALFRWIDVRIQNLQHARLGGYQEAEAADRRQQLFAAAVETTEDILSKFRSLEHNSAEWFLFSCDSAGTEWIKLANKSDIAPILGVAEAVERAEREGRVVRTADGLHWNDAGHEIVGNVLAEYFAERLAGP